MHGKRLHCTIIGNTREQCRKHTGVFLSLGPWDRKWSCCGATHEDIPGCEARRHTFHPEHGSSVEMLRESFGFPPGIFRNGFGFKVNPHSIACWLAKKDGREEPSRPQVPTEPHKALRRPLKLHRRQAARRERREKLDRHDATGWLTEMDLLPD